MSKIISVVSVLFLLVLASTQSCPNPTNIVPYVFLDDIFDKVFPSVTGQPELRNFFTNPNMDTARTYLTSQSSYLITLWIFSGLSLSFFIVCIIQKCCFNCCGSKKCGNKINYSTYSPTSVTCCVYLFMFMSFLLLGITIASFVITSDLIANLNDTTCDVNTTFNYLFDGTPAGYTPVWSGADKFNTYAQNLSINFPNTMPVLNDIFQSSQYSLVTNTNGTTLYNSATNYTCPSNLAVSSVGCPFGNTSLCANNGSSIQIPIFSQNFCDSNATNSSVSLIENQQTLNTTKWKNSLISLQQNINSAILNPVSFSSLVSETSSLSSSFQSFKPSLSQAINTLNNNFNQTKLGSYIFYSSILFIALVSFLSICCIFCTRNFNCVKVVYILWVLFAFLAIIFFLASSVLLFLSFTTFGTCVAYNYYTTTADSFTTFSSYSSNKNLQILNTCFNNGTNKNIFDAFNTTGLSTVQTMANLYNASLPSSNFVTVVNNITNNLTGYVLNPNTANLVGASSSQNPQAALNALNTNPPCNVTTNSIFQYNPVTCYPKLINQSQGASCILLTSDTLSCNDTNYQSLLTFGDNVRALALLYTNSVGLQNYQTAYFNYYQGVMTLLNSNVQSLFQSFLTPYQKLIDQSSCSFLTESLNSLVITSCNRDFPQIYAVSILVTAMAGCFFLMMIMSYFLTVRMEFYAFLNGDLTNYDEDYVEQDQKINIEMADTTTLQPSNRKQLLTQQSPSPRKTSPRK